ncbi:alpha/beta fold hydrolase [Luteimonas salinilitoris]|uniref:Alpha/beta fold hydrolase n=1 Tax=Luteimonas salinilitoris TaxID=3237697 RepID=A0ABV4HNT3_9GAMM
MRNIPSFRCFLALLLFSAVTACTQEQPEQRDGFVDVGGAQLYYQVAGTGPPVVLIHGANLDLRMWDEQMEPLAASFRLIRYDVRPFGRSGPQSEGFSHVEDLGRLMDRLEIEQASLVGLSLGGRIALDFALEHPERVRRMVLAGPGLTGFEQPRDPALAAAIAAARAGEPEQAAKLSLAMPYLAPAMEQAQLAGRVRRLVMENAHAWAMPRPPERLPDPPTIERLAEIHTPTLILLGERDTPGIHAIVARLEHELANAERVTLPGVGHLPSMEAPTEFNRLVLDFFAQEE